MSHVLNPWYWEERYQEAVKSGEMYHALYQTSENVWLSIQAAHQDALSGILSKFAPSARLLNVGCGYGSLLDLIPSSIEFSGVDICPSFIHEARRRYPNKSFTVIERYDNLPFEDQSFQIAVCQSLDGAVKEQVGFSAWRKIEEEILRVSSCLVSLGYFIPHIFRISDSYSFSISDSTPPLEHHQNIIRCDSGHIVYREGQDGSAELYDLFVNEEHRRTGIATQLVKQLEDECFGTIYGFTRASNVVAQQFYASMGYQLTTIEGFYCGEDGVMFVKPFLKRSRQ